MKYVYFTKTLQDLDMAGLIAFFKEVGLDGADLTVRPGYPVTPENVGAELPRAVKSFRDAGLIVGLVTMPTTLSDASSKASEAIFDACGKAGVPAVKIGYFTYKDKYEAGLSEARRRLSAFAKLAERTGVRACYHTHSGNYFGSNAAALRLLLQDVDPHHVGAFLDTGHTAVGGAPIRLELDAIRSWLSLIAIKDMVWEKPTAGAKAGWKYHVVPVGEGIVQWKDFAQGLRECQFSGTISLHAEYETKDLAERKKLAQQELAFLKSRLA